jgi:hypothetical protein
MNLAVGELDVLRAENPEAVTEIKDVIPSSSQTDPSIVIILDPALA